MYRGGTRIFHHLQVRRIVFCDVPSRVFDWRAAVPQRARAAAAAASRPGRPSSRNIISYYTRPENQRDSEPRFRNAFCSLFFFFFPDFRFPLVSRSSVFITASYSLFASLCAARADFSPRTSALSSRGGHGVYIIAGGVGGNGHYADSRARANTCRPLMLYYI